MSFDETRFTLPLDGAETAVGRKECKHCKETKPRAEFSKHSTTDDGLQSWCKACHAGRRAELQAQREAEEKKERATANRSAAQKKRWEKVKAEKQKPEPQVETVKAKRVLIKHTSATDPVNSPGHYKTGGIECIDAMVQVFGEEAVRTYAKVNAFKYIWRHQYKGKPEEDLAKAAWYTRFANGDDPRKDGAE
jgi:hypothetical protein